MELCLDFSVARTRCLIGEGCSVVQGTRPRGLSHLISCSPKTIIQVQERELSELASVRRCQWFFEFFEVPHSCTDIVLSKPPEWINPTPPELEKREATVSDIACLIHEAIGGPRQLRFICVVGRDIFICSLCRVVYYIHKLLPGYHNQFIETICLSNPGRLDYGVSRYA